MDTLITTVNGLRDEILIDIAMNKSDRLHGYVILNMLPVKKIDDLHVVVDYKKYVDLDGLLPVIKDNTPDDIKKLLNVTLTNIINRHLTQSIDWLLISEFVKDRAELVEYIRTEEDVKRVIDGIDFKQYLTNNDDTIESCYDEHDDVTYLIIRNPVNVYTMDDVHVPDTLADSDGEVFKLMTNTSLYSIIMNNGYDKDKHKNGLLIYTTLGRSYLVMHCAYDYITIRKFDISNYIKLD